MAHRRAVDLVRRIDQFESGSVDGIPYLVARVEIPIGRWKRGGSRRRSTDSPPNSERSLLLRHFADCTFADIGRITGVPTFTAASRHRLAIAKLRRLLEKNHEPTS